MNRPVNKRKTLSSAPVWAFLMLLALSLMLFGVGCPTNVAESGSTVTGRAASIPGNSGVPFMRILMEGENDSRFRVTDSNGSYTMLHVQTGDYTVTFAMFGAVIYMSPLIVLEDEQVYTLDLPSLQEGIDLLQGTISDHEEVPIEGTDVWLIYPDGGMAHDVADENGEYEFQDLPTGDITVVAQADGYVIETEEDVYIGFEGTRLLDFGLDPVILDDVGTILGTVTNTDGEVLLDAYVGAFPSGTEPSILAESTDEVLTDADGYELTDLPVGTYTVLCIRSGYAPESELVIVEVDGEYTVDFELISEEELWRESNAVFGIHHAKSSGEIVE